MADLPRVEEHNGEVVCFAVTLSQALITLDIKGASAFENAELEEKIQQATHLMFFGVEDLQRNDELGVALKANGFERFELFSCTIPEDAQLQLAKGLHGTKATKLDIDNCKLIRKSMSIAY